MRHQSHQRATSQAKVSPPINGFIQTTASALPPPGASNTSVTSANVGSSRVSPTSNAFSHSGQNPVNGLDSRTTVNGLTAQQQATLATMNPQQRQLFFMQQHLMRAAGNPTQAGISNPAMLNVSPDRGARLTQTGIPMHSHGTITSHPSGMGSLSLDSNSFPTLKPQGSMTGVVRAVASEAGISLVGSHLPRSQSHVTEEFQGGLTTQMQQQPGSSQVASQFSGNSGNSSIPAAAWSPQSVQHSQGSFGMSVTPSDTLGAPTFGASGQSTGTSWSSGSPGVVDGVSVPSTSSVSLQHNALVDESSTSELDSIFDWGQ